MIHRTEALRRVLRDAHPGVRSWAGARRYYVEHRWAERSSPLQVTVLQADNVLFCRTCAVRATVRGERYAGTPCAKGATVPYRCPVCHEERWSVRDDDGRTTEWLTWASTPETERVLVAGGNAGVFRHVVGTTLDWCLNWEEWAAKTIANRTGLMSGDLLVCWRYCGYELPDFKRLEWTTGRVPLGNRRLQRAFAQHTGQDVSRAMIDRILSDTCRWGRDTRKGILHEEWELP